MFLSSEYERAQWVEALKVITHPTKKRHADLLSQILQEKLPPNTSQAHSMSMVELQVTVVCV